MNTPAKRKTSAPDVMPERRCTAKSKTSGQQCKRYSYPGTNVCATHGAKSPSVKAAADRRTAAVALEKDAQATLAYYGVGVVEDPLEEIGKLASEARAMTDALGKRVNALNDIEILDMKNAPQARVALEAYERSLDRLHRLLDSLVKHGYMERQIRIREGEAAMVAGVIKRVIAGIGLTKEQQATAQTLMAEEFRAIGTLL